jgi:polyketide cyclase/dehydrase/lipid transport protein
MHSVTAVVPRDPQACWRAFTNVPTLTAWVPGLRRAETIATTRGLPGEVHFEFASSFVYTLVYSYDVDNREIRWRPKLGARDAVSGFVRFEPHVTGTQMTYGLEHGDGRGPTERELGDLQRLVDGFIAFVRTAR